MCQGIIVITSRDGKSVVAGTGSHYDLFAKHSRGKLRDCRYDWLGFESTRLNKGPMKITKDGKISGRGSGFHAGFGTNKKARAAAKKFYSKVLKDADSVKAFIQEYGIDDNSLYDLLNASGHNRLRLLQPPTRSNDKEARLKFDLAKLKADAEIAKQITKRNQAFAEILVAKNTELGEKYAGKWNPSLPVTISGLEEIEAEGRELAEHGFMTIPEVMSLVDTARRKIEPLDKKISKKKKDRSLMRIHQFRKITVPKQKIPHNELVAMVFADKDCRSTAWR